MNCKKCGRPIEENSRYCKACGARYKTEYKTTPIEAPFNSTGVQHDMNEPQSSYHNKPKRIPKKKRSKLPAVIAVIVIAILGIAATAVFGVGARDNKKYDERINTGNKYIEEMNYEKAVASFLEADDIIPERQEAYIGAAKGYIGLNKPEKAKELLEKGLENIKDPGGEFLDLCDDLGIIYGENTKTSTAGESEAVTTTATQATQTQTTAADITAIETTVTTPPTTKLETTAATTTRTVVISEENKDFICRFVGWRHEFFDGKNFDAASMNGNEIGSLMREGVVGALDPFYHYFWGEKGLQTYEKNVDLMQQDPLNKFTNYYYSKYDAANVDWIMKNIFNVNPVDEVESYDGGVYFYKYEGYYYASDGGVGWGTPDTKILKMTPLENGDYSVEFQCEGGYHPDGEVVGKATGIIRPKTIGGKTYMSILKIDWSYYQE